MVVGGIRACSFCPLLTNEQTSRIQLWHFMTAKTKKSDNFQSLETKTGV